MDTSPIWMAIPLGTRLTVRCHHPEGGYADSVGFLTRASLDQLELDTRHGKRVIQAEQVALVHVIPTRQSA